jgi:peptidyl-prolyl cis-trans isomerase B (cyclophilin B)
MRHPRAGGDLAAPAALRALERLWQGGAVKKLLFLPAALLVLAGCTAPVSAAPEPSHSGAPGTVVCEYAAGGEAARKVSPPLANNVPATGQVDYVMTLNGSPITLTLDRELAPCTVNSFTSLADQGYFDDTPCHRLTTAGIFVLQCGDPTGTGTGGPGYSFADELSGQETYPAGTLAMANAGPNTNGSQFFIVFADTELPPSYAVFGTVSADGLTVVKNIAAAGVAGGGGDGPPATPVTITEVTRG